MGTNADRGFRGATKDARDRTAFDQAVVAFANRLGEVLDTHDGTVAVALCGTCFVLGKLLEGMQELVVDGADGERLFEIDLVDHALHVLVTKTLEINNLASPSEA